MKHWVIVLFFLSWTFEIQKGFLEVVEDVAIRIVFVLTIVALAVTTVKLVCHLEAILIFVLGPLAPRLMLMRTAAALVLQRAGSTSSLSLCEGTLN